MTTQPITPLRQRMLDDMKLRNMATGTRRSYVRSVADFTAFPEFAVGGERAGIRVWFQKVTGQPDLSCAHGVGGAGWFSRRRGSSWVVRGRAF